MHQAITVGNRVEQLAGAGLEDANVTYRVLSGGVNRRHPGQQALAIGRVAERRDHADRLPTAEEFARGSVPELDALVILVVRRSGGERLTVGTEGERGDGAAMADE